MAFTFGFYNSMRGDRKYNADQVGALFDGLLNDGVYASIGEIFATVPGEGMSVVVKTGRAWFNRTWNENNSHMILTLSESNVLLPRFDAVVLEVDKRDNVRQNRILIVEGTPSANPVHPNLINNAEVGFFQHPLAYVKVDPNVVAIAPDKIQIMVGTNECPFVTGILRLSSIDDLYQGWEYQFQEWWKGIKALLNENTVGRLQAQIDERVKYTDKVDVNNLSQINDPNDNSHWVTPASMNKAIKTQANPIGTSMLPGQQPSGVGSWGQFNGLYIQNMPDGPTKTFYKKRYGYYSTFRFYKEWQLAQKRGTYDEPSGNQAILIRHVPSSTAKALIYNMKTGAYNELAVDGGTRGIAYCGGILGLFNKNGHFYWNGLDIVLEVPNRPNYHEAINSAFHLDPSKIVIESGAWVGSSENWSGGVRVMNSTGAVERYIPSSSLPEGDGAPIKLEDGIVYSIYKNGKLRLSDLTVHGNGSSRIESLVREKLNTVPSGNRICWSTNFEYLYLNDYIIRTANGGQRVSAAEYIDDMGRHMSAIRMDSYSGRRSLGWVDWITMGIPNELAPKIAVETCPVNYVAYTPPFIYASMAYASDFTDGSFSAVDIDVDGTWDSSTSSNRTNRWVGESLPTMMAWSLREYDEKSPSSLGFGVTVVTDDPSKVRVPYDPIGSTFRFA